MTWFDVPIVFSAQRCLVLDVNTGTKSGCGVTYTLKDLVAIHREGKLAGWLCPDCYGEVADDDGRVHLSGTH